MKTATSITFTRTLDPDPEPWTRTLETWTLKTWTLKNLHLEKHGKRLDMEKWLEEHILELINIENLLRRDV